MTGGEREAPLIRDSDVIYLAVKRLDAIAGKMQRLEYDEKLDEMMREAADLFEWAALNISRRRSDEDES